MHGLINKKYHHTLLGFQGTVGSSSTWSEFDRYRMAGATARTMLVEAAAIGARQKMARAQVRACFPDPHSRSI